MSAGGEITSSNDDASFAKANAKQLLIDTGTNIEAATKTISGQVAHSTNTSVRKWHGKYYGLNNTGTVWANLESALLYPVKYGKFNPNSSTFANNVSGLFQGATSYGSVAVAALDTTWGTSVEFTTGAGAGNTAGFRLGARHTCRDFNPVCRFRVKSDANSNLRWFIGLVGDTAELGNTDDPLNALNGFLFGKITTQANYRCLHNDGVGATISDDTGVAADNSPHYIDIYTKGAATSTFYLTIDSVLRNTVTTEIPAASSTLAFQMTIINAGGTRVMTVYDCLVTSDL